jgi:PPP family 3-phenylpropionic acid transporter
MVGVPMVNSMAFIYEKAGGVINYGLCRGLGSAAYAVGANMVGRLWAILGARTLPIVIVVGSLFTLCAALIMPPEPKDEVADTEAPAEKPASISIWPFFGRYSKVVPIICALVLLYFCHNVVNTYMGAILANIMVGATDAQVAEVQGNALFIQAMVELPIMFGFVFIMRKLTINQILVISAVFYSLKHIIILLAPSVPMFYAAMVLQMFSYAAIAPAVVYFCNEQVAAEDQNKGQAIFITSNSVGSLLASFVGGWLFQLLGVQVGLTIGVGASIVGTVLMVIGCGRLGLARKVA